MRGTEEQTRDRAPDKRGHAAETDRDNALAITKDNKPDKLRTELTGNNVHYPEVDVFLHLMRIHNVKKTAVMWRDIKGQRSERVLWS